MTAIETTALAKHYGDVVALDGLDLTVADGEVFGFLGPNGAGKSTTINLLLGFTSPTAGGATVLGHDVETASLALRDRVGVLPEHFTAYDRLTGTEHVEYAAALAGADADPDRLLDRVGLASADRDRPAGGYSTGMTQRLALACALVGDPDLLILDEPSSGLDPSGMADIRELIATEAAEGTTVFFSSHILAEVEAVCDRIGILVEGSLAATGTIEELREGTAANGRVELAVDAVPDAIGERVAGIDGVADVAVSEGQVAAEVTRPTAKIDVIEAVADRATVRDVISEETSLEAVFHRYAGETEAEGEPASPLEVSQ